MSKSGTKSGTKTRKVLLTRESIEAGLDPSLTTAIEQFQPLSFPAGGEAARWLRNQVEAPDEKPWQVILMLDEKTDELLGFLVLGYTMITLSPGDVPMIAKKLEAPLKPQVALEVAWIARSAGTEKGFGHELFTYSVSFAIDGGAVALVVTPHDEETAEKVWIKRFRFRLPREADQSPEAPLRLWYPVYKYEGGGWPS
jgi:hypothetical protein